jgi:peroxiredoxin Q/BCP
MPLFVMKNPLRAGKPVPDIALPDQDGVIRRLSDYRGQKVVLFFYPKDDTPG